LFVLPLLTNTSFLDSSVVLATFCMCFPFLHNGFYYTRFSESKTSSAKFNFGYVFRTVCFMVGVISFLTYSIF
jgi:hypothetical protein